MLDDEISVPSLVTGEQTLVQMILKMVGDNGWKGQAIAGYRSLAAWMLHSEQARLARELNLEPCTKKFEGVLKQRTPYLKHGST